MPATETLTLIYELTIEYAVVFVDPNTDLDEKVIARLFLIPTPAKFGKPFFKQADDLAGAANAGSKGKMDVDSLGSKGIGKGEQVLDKVNTYEQARNKTLELVGDLGLNSQPYTGTLKSSTGFGQVVGRQSADRKVRWRLDYDPNKGTHINIEDFRNGKGANARKIAIPFEGDESTFKSLLKHLNR